MAALGSKRKRFLGVGDDRMEVTSLIRSLVELPLGADGARVHPSPGAAHGSRLALQTCAGGADPRCVAFVASGGGVWRHDVAFAGGEAVAEGKEAMLKPVTVRGGVTKRVHAVAHRSEIQSLAVHDPESSSVAARDASDRPPSNDVRGDDDDDGVKNVVWLASADARGRCLVTPVDRATGAARPDRQLDLRATESGDPAVPGWAGAAFDPGAAAAPEDPPALAVARHWAKTLELFNPGETRPARTMRALLRPNAVTFVPPNGGFRVRNAAASPDGKALGVREKPGFFESPDPGASKQKEDVAQLAFASASTALVAMAEGDQLSVWDPRARGSGCVRRQALCNRSAGLFAAGALPFGYRGADGGGGAVVAGVKVGAPIVLVAGAERGVHAVDAGRGTVVKRWPAAMKFEITAAAPSYSAGDYAYVAGLDNELVCGCWARASMAGGFAFRGDSRWLGVGVAAGIEGRDEEVVAGWCESGHLYAARVRRTKAETTREEEEGDAPDAKRAEKATDEEEEEEDEEDERGGW